jgi:hypothetical protein
MGVTVPAEARDGLTRVWLQILRERHPEVAWVAIGQEPHETKSLSRILDPSGTARHEEAIEDKLLVSSRLSS